MAKYKYLHRVTVEKTSNVGLALNNVPETVKHLEDQRLQGGNLAEISQVSERPCTWCNEVF